jgi:L,D-peptidoglycan transpeptidase YkuD (ErfK/YbiS/YcfS/YnhG family)
MSLSAGIAAPVWAQRPLPVGIPGHVRQVIAGVADDWSATRGKIQLYERAAVGSPWRPMLESPISVLFGAKGLAWGNGVVPVPHGRGGIPSKREKDRRAPAGLFRIGTLYGDAASAPAGVRWPWHQVTARDCWIDDPTHPAYNRHIEVDPAQPPPWYAKQKMRLGDFAYEFLLEVRHNADPPLPGHGSAIFFHIRRGPDKPSAGCTTMARADLLKLLARLRPEAHTHYVLLPKSEYVSRQGPWGLPPMP